LQSAQTATGNPRRQVGSPTVSRTSCPAADTFGIGAIGQLIVLFATEQS
jgi:hypothetical protein